MLVRGFKLALLLSQAFWMLVVLPGHVRGMLVVNPGGPSATHASCCDADDAPAGKPAKPISQDRKDRCAVCFQAVGYDLPPVYDVDLAPTGLCELCRLIEPSKRHRLLFDATYNATAPPAA